MKNWWNSLSNNSKKIIKYVITGIAALFTFIIAILLGKSPEDKTKDDTDKKTIEFLETKVKETVNDINNIEIEIQKNEKIQKNKIKDNKDKIDGVIDEKDINDSIDNFNKSW